MRASLAELAPDMAGKARKLVSLAAERGIELVVTSTYRTFAEQEALYAQGRTQPGPVVTQARAGWSLHNHRRAFDVAIKDYPGDATPHDYFDGPWGVVGELGESLGLEWGGRWRHTDKPHFEDRLGQTLAWWATQPETANLA